jgi:hypothetical protein
LSLAVLCAAIFCFPVVDASASSAGSGSIEGVVTAEGGTPLAEVWVCAYLTASEEFGQRCDFTGGDGLYALKGLAGGRYKVEFWSEATEPSYVGEYYNNKTRWEDADEVEVKEAIAVRVDAELAEGATIEGEVRAASLGGPLGEWNALVCATLPSWEPIDCTPTRAGGSYTLSGLPAGEYKVQFVPSSAYNLLNQFYDHKAEPTEAESLNLATGESKTGIDADLEPGAEIHGTIYSAVGGSPLEKVSACALFYEPILEAWLPARCVPTTNGGQYSLFGLWSDNYKVSFSADTNEIFGEGPHHEDGYFAQYFDDKSTLAAADTLAMTAPEVRSGIDAHLQPKPTVSFPAPPGVPPVLVTTRPHSKQLHCRSGFRRRTIAGKRRCVKGHKHRRHHGHRKAA